MKRNDDGYVLPLVLVVLTVLALVASSVLSASLRNLQVQHKAADRMQEKYIAEGKIEKVVATLLDEKNYQDLAKPQTPLIQDENTTTENQPDGHMCEAVKKQIEVICKDYLNGSVHNWNAQKLADKTVFTYTLNLKASEGSREITCKIELKGSMESKETEENGEKKTTYEAKELSLVYKEYQIGGAGA